MRLRKCSIEKGWEFCIYVYNILYFCVHIQYIYYAQKDQHRIRR
jgi:hypothetical protein